MKDYSHLKGKEVLCCFLKSNKNYTFRKGNWKGFVADIDINVGITIKHKKTEEDLWCVNKNVFSSDEQELYKKDFEFAIECIEKGILNEKNSPIYLTFDGNSGGSQGCAFE